MTDPREEKTPEPTPEQMIVLLRYRLSKEQRAVLCRMLQDETDRETIVEGLQVTE